VIKTWDDGSPQWQLVVTLQTSQRDRSIEDDDGKRRVFLRWYGSDKKAVEDAVSKAGDQYVKVGAWMRVTYTGLGKAANPRLNPPRVYDVQYRAANSVEALMSKPGPNGATTVPPADLYGPASASTQGLPGAVAAARETQQSAALGGEDRREAIDKVRKLIRAGFGADEIAGMVTLSREAIEAIIAVG
jgi:hypothetical protein